MLGKTHMTVGIAATLAITAPNSTSELFTAISIGTVGALISDIDVESSESCRRANQFILLASAAIICLFALDYIGKMNILQTVAGNKNMVRILMGMLLFIGLCIFGKGHPHRSFMHSFLALALLDAAIGLAFPAFVPYFTIGFLSHLALDLFNHKKVKLLYPLDTGFCLGWFHASGMADSLLCMAGGVASILIFIKSLLGIFGK